MSDSLIQQQFLNVLDRDEAQRRFHAALDLRPLEAEAVPLAAALGRVLAEDVVAPIDVPGFDRSDVDGFAVQAADTFGAAEDRPRLLGLNEEVLTPGVAPGQAVRRGTATAVATGAALPRGADAVVMIEDTDIRDGQLLLTRPAAPGGHVTFAGTDIGRGETVLRQGERLTSRETGVLAALGIALVAVVRRPRVAVLSTGAELAPPGEPLQPGMVHDSNGTVIADAVRELGGEPVPLGIVPDDDARLDAVLASTLDADALLLSGGTSKGAGDLSYRAVARLGSPGIVAHGVALKPGKPLCLAAVDRPGRRPLAVAVLPGFPTSAVFTFHEFIAPVLRALAGLPERPAEPLRARLAMRVNSQRGRTEFLLVRLVEAEGVCAYPMGKGSGSVTAFAQADGFIAVPRQQEYVEAGAAVDVRPLGAELRPADLTVIGSHCTGLDFLLGLLRRHGFASRALWVGSTAGLEAAKRGECDLAGVHLLDPATDVYNRPFLDASVALIPGYGRTQGVVFRPEDRRFTSENIVEALADPDCVMVNRNRGSGTRLLIDRLLGGRRPAGYLTETRSHNAVVAAVAQGRADWGVAIDTAARPAGLGFLPLRDEQYDFVVPRGRLDRPAVRAFAALLRDPATRLALVTLGFRPAEAD